MILAPYCLLSFGVSSLPSLVASLLSTEYEMSPEACVFEHLVPGSGCSLGMCCWMTQGCVARVYGYRLGSS